MKQKHLTPDELNAEITRLEDEAAARFNSRVQRFAYRVRRSLDAKHFKYPAYAERRIQTTIRVGLELALASKGYEFRRALEAEFITSGFKATQLDSWFLFWVTVDLYLADAGTPADAAPDIDPFNDDMYKEKDYLKVPAVLAVRNLWADLRTMGYKPGRLELSPLAEKYLRFEVSKGYFNGVGKGAKLAKFYNVPIVIDSELPGSTTYLYADNSVLFVVDTLAEPDGYIDPDGDSERFGLFPPSDAELEAAITQQMESGIKDILLNTLAADNDADPDDETY